MDKNNSHLLKKRKNKYKNSVWIWFDVDTLKYCCSVTCVLLFATNIIRYSHKTTDAQYAIACHCREKTTTIKTAIICLLGFAKLCCIVKSSVSQWSSEADQKKWALRLVPLFFSLWAVSFSLQHFPHQKRWQSTWKRWRRISSWEAKTLIMAGLEKTALAKCYLKWLSAIKFRWCINGSSPCC